MGRAQDTAPGGAEYAILGTTTGTAIYDVTVRDLDASRTWDVRVDAEGRVLEAPE